MEKRERENKRAIRDLVKDCERECSGVGEENPKAERETPFFSFNFNS